MSNYVVEGGFLTSIANALREKANISDALLFPIGFIDTIYSMGNGALPWGVTEVAYGNFLPTSTITSTSGFKISHGMSVTPNFFAIWAVGTKNSTNFNKYNVFQCCFGVNIQRTSGTQLQGFGTTFSYAETADNIVSQVPTKISDRFTSEYVIPYLTDNSGVVRLKSFADYFWFAGRLEHLS